MVQTVDLKVTGMTCEHCVRAVTGAIQDSDGVNSARVDLEKGAAHFEGEGFDLQKILAAIEEEGYEAEVVGS